MPLSSGTRIGSFEVIAAIGAGGMGEVYRARDTKLDRTVALKVLPDAFTSDPERLARFEREAKVLASLNHPNIAQVYGFEGTAIAMELVEGPTLDEIISGAASADGSPATGLPARMPLERALAIARQIATGLEAAHDQGIIHRDLKPANVKVREDGTVKVLDFGLAKAFAADAEAAASGVSNSPTLTARSTQLGMILGTAAYMAPEQAKGRAVDRRADVWAFGVVLFEMLAGRRAFEGDDVSDVLASVLKTEPEWSGLPSDLPGPVRRLIQRCLVKDPKRRLRDVAEGLLQMDEGLAAASATAAATSQIAAPIVVHERAPLWRRVIPIAVTAVVTAAAMYGVSVWRTPAPVAKTPIRFAHVPPAAAPLYTTQSHPDLAVSPDGNSIVYVSLDGALPVLWIRHLDQLEPTPLRGAEAAVGPFVSADNAWVGFSDASDQTVLKKVSILGGPSTNLGKMKSQIFGGSWTDDKSIVIGQSAGPLMILGEGGGEAKSLTTLDEANRESGHIWPHAVPGSSVVLFVATLGSLTPISGGQIAALDRATGRIERLKLQGVMPRYVKTGHLVYASQDGTLRAVKFDLKSMKTSGNPVPVVEGVGVKVSGAAEYDVASDGRLIYAAASSNLLANRTLAWVERTGKETAIAAQPRAYFYARLSPDATRVALDVRDTDQNTWIWDLNRETLLRLTDRPGQYQYGLWVPPDGQRVVFSSVSAGQTDLYRMNADGTGQMERLTDTSKEKMTPYPNAITPDGKEVIFRASTAQTRNDLYVASLIGGDRKFRKLLATDHDELNATISPDGKWMAYQSDLPGHYEVYVRPYPDVESRQIQLSTAGGVKPVWSPTGKEIFYVSTTGWLMSVPVDTTKGFAPGKPVQLFNAKPYFTAGVGTNYDVTRDGRRFVMVKVPEAVESAGFPIVMVLNWADELASRLK